MSMLRVDFAALQQGVADIQKGLNTLENQLAELERDAGPLVASWEGEAKQQYDDRQRRWTQASVHLQGILREIKGALEASAASYLETEQKAAQRFA